jgi:hypothetical protein
MNLALWYVGLLKIFCAPEKTKYNMKLPYQIIPPVKKRTRMFAAFRVMALSKVSLLQGKGFRRQRIHVLSGILDNLTREQKGNITDIPVHVHYAIGCLLARCT